jgi:hypothetical protein
MSRGMTAEEAFDAPEEHLPRLAILAVLRDHGVKTVCTPTAFEADGSGAPDSTFLAEFGDEESYSLAAVLAWLGY